MVSRRAPLLDASPAEKLLGDASPRLGDAEGGGASAGPGLGSSSSSIGGRGRVASPVPAWACHLALALVQVSFVMGAVYLKRGLSQLSAAEAAYFHPLMFVFFRTGTAGPVLLGVAATTTSHYLPHREDAVRVMLLGLFLFLNQSLYILGLKSSGALVASCMQPAIPVFTHILAVAARYESTSLQKGAGILLAVAGAVSMVMRSADSAVGGSNMLLGNLCLVGNTLSMACYFIAAKGLTRGYPPLCLTAWAYMTAACCLLAAVLTTCPLQDWRLPAPLVGPLLFWILGCSIFAYFTMTAATKYLPASEVAAYQCLQPLLGTLLSVLVLHEQPTWWDLGALGVVGGLVLVTFSFGVDSSK